MQSSSPSISLPPLVLCSFFLLVVSSLAQPAALDYPTANLSRVWTNSPSFGIDGSPFERRGLYLDGSIARVVLLRFNPDRYGPSFAFGFFCLQTVTTTPAPPNNNSETCTDFLLGVAFVGCSSGGHLVSSPFPQVIWSAKQGRPFHENATLRFSPDGDLVLRDADGSSLWSAGTAGRSVAGINVTGDGNLVLFDDKNATVWQSFDHPTDVLVPGQWLKRGSRLTPNVSSATNWMESPLYLEVTSYGIVAFVGSDPPQSYYASIYVFVDQDGYVIYSNGSLTAFNKSRDENGTAFPFEIPYITSRQELQYIRLESDGHLRLYKWESAAAPPKPSWEISDLINLQQPCDYPTVCGPYGICSTNQQCSCPPSSHFSPVDDRELRFGCKPWTPVSACQSAASQDYQMLSLEGTNTFNHGTGTVSIIDEEGCKQACLKNCSCKMALFQYGIYQNRSEGGCSLYSEVFSLQTHIVEVYHSYSNVHLKVHNDPVSVPTGDVRSKSNMVGIALGVVIPTVSVVVSAIILLSKKREQEI